MANGYGTTRAHQLGSDPISMALRIPAFIDTLRHNRRIMALTEEKAALDAEIAKEAHEVEYGRDVPDLSRRIDWGRRIAPEMNVAISRPSPTAPEYETRHIPGLKERALGLRGREAGAYEARTGAMGRRVGVEESQEEREQAKYNLAKTVRTVEEQPFSQGEYNEMMRILDDDDATNDTMVARAMEPLTRRLKSRVGRGAKYETYQGLKEVLSKPGVREKLVTRLQRARASEELIEQVRNGSFLDLQMPACAALYKIKAEERAAKKKTVSGQLTEFQKNKMLQNLNDDLESFGDDPTSSQIQEAQTRAEMIGGTIQWGKVPGAIYGTNRRLVFVPVGQPTEIQPSGLRGTGGSPAPTPEEAAAYLRSQGISF